MALESVPRDPPYPFFYALGAPLLLSLAPLHHRVPHGGPAALHAALWPRCGSRKKWPTLCCGLGAAAAALACLL